MKEWNIFAFPALAHSCLPDDPEHSVTSDSGCSWDLHPHLETSVSGGLFPQSLRKHFAMWIPLSISCAGFRLLIGIWAQWVSPQLSSVKGKMP